MITDLKINASGVVSIYNANKELLFTRSNATLPGALFLLAQLLMQNVSANLNKIRVYSGSSLVYTGDIDTRVYLGNNEIQLGCNIPAEAAIGSFNKLLLGPDDDATLGDFAISQNFNFTQPPAQAILITWNIKFN